MPFAAGAARAPQALNGGHRGPLKRGATPISGPGQSKMVAQDPKQRRVRIGLDFVIGAVKAELCHRLRPWENCVPKVDGSMIDVQSKSILL
jgi:hypothetical protein